MTGKPRIGRPPNTAGHEYQVIGVSGTPQEIAAVMELTPRQRIEAMLDKVRNRRIQRCATKGADAVAVTPANDKPAQGKE